MLEGDLIAKLDPRNFRNNLNTATTEFDNADSAFARAQMDSMAKALEGSELRAPFEGIIAAVNAENFQNASAQQPVMTLQSDRAMEAVISVPA